MDQDRLIRTIRAHIAKGAMYGDKSEQHYISAGRYLLELKEAHDAHEGSWDEWETLLKDKVGIGKSRASELMQIADGRKTPDEVRADTSHRKQEHRDRQRLLSVRNGEDEPETNETKIKALLSGAERARLCARFDGVPNQEVIEAVRRTADAWNALHASMLATKDGRCPWIEDDGGRGKSGVPYADEKAGDCVARAIAIATQKPYREVHDALIVGKVHHAQVDSSSYGKWVRRRGGVRRFDADHGCAHEVYGPYREALGWKYTVTPSRGAGKVHLRADQLPPGRLVVSISGHLVAVIDHVIRDTYDCGGEGRVHVKGYWRAA